VAALDFSIFRDGSTVHEHRNGLRREVKLPEEVGVRFVRHVDGVRLAADDLNCDVHER
jgi:hypothetical protein